MGKNHRHKKKLKSEKGKTQLKTAKTKFLPKGQNVTNTSFKIKPIVIKEQLQQHASEHVSSKNLNLKDLLNRLKHHNANVKQENLIQLKQYANTIDPVELSKHVGEIIQAILPLISDVEQKVRRGALSALDSVFVLRGESSIEPFFDIVTCFLCCCMTHINGGVQEDSLLLLDSIMNRLPNLLARKCERVVKNFISLISKVKLNVNDRTTLQTNVKTKKTNVQWRLAVLMRMKRLLEIILRYEKLKVDHAKDMKTVYCSENETISMHKSIKFIDPFECVSKEILWLEECIDDTVPLLNDICIEVMPRENELIETCLDEKSLEILNYVLSISHLFYELSEGEKVDKKLLSLILRYFPYVTMKNCNSNIDSKCVKENLLFCYLHLVSFKGKIDSKVYDYVNFCLNNKNVVKYDNMKMFLMVLKMIFDVNYKGRIRNEEQLNLLNSLAEFYRQYKKTDDYGVDILMILSTHFDKIGEYSSKLTKIACSALLEGDINPKLIDALRLLVVKGVKSIHKHLKIIKDDVLVKIKAECSLGHENVMKISSLFSYIE